MAATTQIGTIDPIAYHERISCTYYISADFDNPTAIDNYITFSNYSKLGYINFHFYYKKSGNQIQNWASGTKLFTITTDHCPLVATQDVPAYAVYRSALTSTTTCDYTSGTIITLKGYTSGGKNYIDLCSSSLLQLSMMQGYPGREVKITTAFILQ